MSKKNYVNEKEFKSHLLFETIINVGMTYQYLYFFVNIFDANEIKFTQDFFLGVINYN